MPSHSSHAANLAPETEARNGDGESAGEAYRTARSLRIADVYSRIAVAATSLARSASSLAHASFFFRLRSLASSRLRSVRSIRCC